MLETYFFLNITEKCSRSTHGAYYFTPLIEPAKEAVTKTVIQTLTVYRDSGELQLNGNLLYLCACHVQQQLMLFIFIINLAPPIQNARLEKYDEIVVYGILGFIRLQAGKNRVKCNRFFFGYAKVPFRRVHDCHYGLYSSGDAGRRRVSRNEFPDIAYRAFHTHHPLKSTPIKRRANVHSPIRKPLEAKCILFLVSHEFDLVSAKASNNNTTTTTSGRWLEKRNMHKYIYKQ